MKKLLAHAAFALLVAAGGIVFPANASAGQTTTVAVCHGCTANQMKRTASRSSSGGFVYVFNQTDAEVRKYFVYFDADDSGGRYSVTKVTEERPVGMILSRRWRNVARDAGEASDQLVLLPPDFGIRSVAGAYLSPNYATTLIEDYMSGLPFWDGFLQNVSMLLAEVINSGLPLVGNVIHDIRIVVQFPDGSTAEFVVNIDIVITSASSSEAQFELEPPDDGRMADGRPIPGGGSEWGGVTITDGNGSIADWINWARQNGIRVTGPGGGALSDCPTIMVCEYDGLTVHCVVRGDCS